MIETALRAVLMATIGASPLLASCGDTTFRTAITLTAITGTTNGENRVASAAYSLPKDNLVLFRHPGCQVGLDKDYGSWQGRGHQVLDLMATSPRLPSWDLAVPSGRDPRVVFHLFQNNLHHRCKFLVE
jgi:hypothetical protein